MTEGELMIKIGHQTIELEKKLEQAIEALSAISWMSGSSPSVASIMLSDIKNRADNALKQIK